MRAGSGFKFATLGGYEILTRDKLPLMIGHDRYAAILAESDAAVRKVAAL